MENLFALLGTLFFLFLVLAAAVEVILEMFRGVLERLGFSWAKGKVTLEEALKLAAEFAPSSTNLNAKLEAVRSVAAQFQKKSQETFIALDAIKTKLANVGPAQSLDSLAGEINEIANHVKAKVEASEGKRIFILRTIAATFGCVLVYSFDFNIFRLLASSPEAKQFAEFLANLQGEWFNVFMGGLAAAAGSSYWHDQLDRVRNLKAVVAEAKKLAT